ncbi:MAG: sulfite exporter TauE/SafE family protein [Marinobacterium sp.]|nr:sulfite exporter TauE/SafE family protein [Marinobacterium sp.]
MLTDPLFLLVAIPAIVITGISKGGFGGGLGTLAVPLMALAIAPVQAAAIMLPILCVMDLFAIWHFRGHADWKQLRILLPAAIAGIALGAAGFHALSEAQIKLMIGTISLGFVGHQFMKRHNQTPSTTSTLRGSFWGTIAGFTSFGIHAGGPPISIYLLPLQLSRTVFAATTIVFFTTVNQIKLVPYIWLGQFNTDNLLTSLMLSPLAPLGIWLGRRLHTRISDRGFFLVCYGLLAVAGIKLIRDGWLELVYSP